MNKQPLIISIPNPCHESWDAMTPANKGRFCQSCQKTVTDFSCMSDKEIISYLNNRQGEVCGRFNTTQLNKEICVPATVRKQPFISIAAMVTALSIAIPSAQAKNNTEKIQFADRFNTTPQQKDTIQYIRGVIIDGTNKSILPGANIILKGRRISTVSDSSGKFELPLPENYKEKTVTLEIHYIGYLISEFVVPLGNVTSEREFSMEPDKFYAMQPVVLAGAIAVVRTQRANFWQRFKYKVGHLFR